MPNDGSPERRASGPADDDLPAAQVFDPVAFAKRLEVARAQREQALARRRERASGRDARSEIAGAASAAPVEPAASAPPEATEDVAAAEPDRLEPPPDQPLVAPPRPAAPPRARGPRRGAVAVAALLALATAAALTVPTGLRDRARGLLAGPLADRPGAGPEAIAVDLAKSQPDAAGAPVAWATASAPAFQPAAGGGAPAVATAEPIGSIVPSYPGIDLLPRRLALVVQPSNLGAPAAPTPPRAAEPAAVAGPPPPVVEPAVDPTPAVAGDPARPPAVAPPEPPAEAPQQTAALAPPSIDAAESGPRSDPPAEAPAHAAALAPPTPTAKEADPLPTPEAPSESLPQTTALAPPDSIEATPTPAAPITVPLGAPVISVHAPPSISEAALANAVAAVGVSGFPTVRGVRVGFAIGQTHVRFYHTADLAPAQRLAASLGAGVRDFTSYSPPPEPGRIEVWLSGGDARASPAPAAAEPPTATPAATTITATPLGAPPAAATGQRSPAAGQVAPALGRPVPAFVVGRTPIAAPTPAPPRPQPAFRRLLGQVGIGGLPAHDRIRR